MAIDPEVEAEIRNRLISHSQDPDAHDLAQLRARISALESTVGIWSVVARDQFAGTSGPLTTTETGQTWSPWLAPNMPYHTDGKCVTPNGGTRGAVINTAITDGQIEAALNPGNASAGLYFRYKDAVNFMFLARIPDGLGLSRQVNDVTTALAPTIFFPFVPGERVKVRFLGPIIRLFRVFEGVEELVLTVEDDHWLDQTRYGVRVAGTASVDNFRLLGREAL
jgi:hypothetical protein